MAICVSFSVLRVALDDSLELIDRIVQERRLVFVSHAGEDHQAIRGVCGRVPQRGFVCAWRCNPLQEIGTYRLQVVRRTVESGFLEATRQLTPTGVSLLECIRVKGSDPNQRGHDQQHSNTSHARYLLNVAPT